MSPSIPRLMLTVIVVSLALSGILPAFADDAKPAAPPAKRPNTAIKPSPGNVRWFMRNHASNMEKTKQNKFELCLLGDSITAMWPGDLQQKYCGKSPTANFGIGGDRTENVLWRLDRGELQGTSPKVIVLLIGTNNMGFNSAEEIAEGVKAVVTKLRTRLPATKILVVGIFPKNGVPLSKIAATNAIVAKLDDGTSVRYRDFGAQFVEQDGKIRQGILSDGVHLTKKGYEIWGEAMAPVLAAMMSSVKTESAEAKDAK